MPTFSIAFSWMKMYSFRLRSHWSFFPMGPINNIPALVQIMAWSRPGDKPLFKPMIVSLLTLICVTRPQRLKLRVSLHTVLTVITKIGSKMEIPRHDYLHDEPHRPLLYINDFENDYIITCKHVWVVMYVKMVSYHPSVQYISPECAIYILSQFFFIKDVSK